jgi:hypothetical protein
MQAPPYSFTSLSPPLCSGRRSSTACTRSWSRWTTTSCSRTPTSRASSTPRSASRTTTERSRCDYHHHHHDHHHHHRHQCRHHHCSQHHHDHQSPNLNRSPHTPTRSAPPPPPLQSRPQSSALGSSRSGPVGAETADGPVDPRAAMLSAIAAKASKVSGAGGGVEGGLAFAAPSAQPLYAAPSHLVCITSGHRQDDMVWWGRGEAFSFVSLQ